MAKFYFNPTTDFITLKFKCPKCFNIEETESFYVPTPDLSAETHQASVNSEQFEHVCSHCRHEFNIQIHNGYNGGYGEISELDSISSIEVEEEEFPNDENEE